MLVSIGKKYGKTVAQVVLRWLTQRDLVVIPKSVRKERIEANFNIFDFDLSADERSAITSQDTGQSLFFDHRDPASVKWLSETTFPT